MLDKLLHTLFSFIFNMVYVTVVIGLAYLVIAVVIVVLASIFPDKKDNDKIDFRD